MTDHYPPMKRCSDCDQPFEEDTDNRLCPDCNREYDRLDGAMTQERWVVRVQPRDESVPGPTRLIRLPKSATKEDAQRKVEALTDAETFAWAVKE